MPCVSMLNQQVIGSNKRIEMNKMTQEVMDSVNTLVKFRGSIPNLLTMFPETKNDLEIIKPYIDYEIQKILKDIIHIERL